MKFIFLSALHAELENFKKLKVFICLSTVMTWARSKPLDPVSLPASKKIQNKNT